MLLLFQHSRKFLNLSSSRYFSSNSSIGSLGIVSEIKTETEGRFGSLEWRKYFKDIRSNTLINPLNDIPAFAHHSAAEEESGKIFCHFITEIPEFTKTKCELNPDIEHTPIVQDSKKGKPRYLSSIIHWNYGSIPQTLESTETETIHLDSFPSLTLPGDGDPVDAIELGGFLDRFQSLGDNYPKLTFEVNDSWNQFEVSGEKNEQAVGEIMRVKILGSLGLIDEGEIDWKVLTISDHSPLCDKVDSIHDLPAPILATIIHYYKNYKVPDGKEPNEIAWNDEPLSASWTLENIILNCHNHWQQTLK